MLLTWSNPASYTRLGGVMEQDKLTAIQTRIAALEKLTTVGSAQAVAAWEIVILLDRIAVALDRIAEHGLLT